MPTPSQQEILDLKTALAICQHESAAYREALEDIACLDPLTQGDVAIRNARRALQSSKGE